MARIPEAVVERLKAEVSVQRLAEARGVSLTRHGADLHGRCPFHDDKTPSLVITPAKNLWHCLGACQTGGSVIDWVMKAEGVSFRHAVELLVNEALPLVATAAAPSSAPPKHSTVRKLPTALACDVEDAKLLMQVIEYYHGTLLGSPEALDYLKRRGIAVEEAITTFKLGFANRTLGYRLPDSTRVEGAQLRGQLQRLGLYRSSGHEHFSGSLVIPVIGAGGQITEVYGRKLNDNLRPGTPLHLYLPGPHKGVWNAPALGASKEIILCESLIDALTFWCAGYRNVTASYGVEGFTADHLAAFQSHGIERVLIAYDRDEAGDRAAQKLAAQLTAEGLDCYRILFPKGMDANEYALKVGPPAKSLGVVIRSAQWLGKGKPKPLDTASADISIVVAAVNEPIAAMSVKDELLRAAPLPPLVAASGNELSAAEIALSAQVIPEAPVAPSAPASKSLGTEREYSLAFGPRRYRVRGLEKNLSYEVLKVNVLVSAPALEAAGEADAPPQASAPAQRVHIDTLDLYQARARAAFVKSASVELGIGEQIIKADLGKLLLALEAEQEKLITAAREPSAPIVVAIENQARARALNLLTSADLVERIASDFSRAGIVGERANVLIGYLAAVSRKLDRPLALLIQSTSAAGKSSLLDAILRFVPEEDRIVYSAVTGQSLFYMGERDLKHKILAIAEEHGAARASYALKLLQSEGELTIASTSKDVATGKLVTEEYRVEGPVMIALTTTAAEVDEELLNRCLILTIDEGREQTAAIHAAQRERRTLAGLLAKTERETILKTHQDAQRLLEPLAVVNPYAHRLTFLDDRTRTRRDHEKYLTLIDAIALLHQHQRTIKTIAANGTTLRYIEAEVGDIALANQLAHEVLGRTLDELPPQTRKLLALLVAMVEKACEAQQMPRAAYRFSRRQVREATKWGDTQLKVHLARLVELEYLLIHRGGRGQSFEYELLFDGAMDGSAHVSGLIDIEALRAACAAQPFDAQGSGVNDPRSVISRGVVDGLSADGRVPENRPPREENRPLRIDQMNGAQTAQLRPSTTIPSYAPAAG
ncbi:MAG: toprim domain-containing protein [Proteobacteria bacterium]|nr:toprim domain-containing protein [Pseudomonadota bacterium]